MPNQQLPPDDHIVRYVPKRLLLRDEDGSVIGVLPQAFVRRDGEAYLSVTWLEHFVPDDYEQGLIGSVAAIRRQLDVKKKDGFSTGLVGDAAKICRNGGVKARILHEPKPPENTGHAAFRGVPREDLILLGLLASDAFKDTRAAATIP